MADQNNKMKNSINYTASFLGAAGTGLQNYMGTTQFIQYWMNQSFALADVGKGIAHGCGAVLGGASSVFVNYLLNVELITDFFKRLKRLRDRAQLRAIQKHYDKQLAKLRRIKMDAEHNAEQICALEESTQKSLDVITELRNQIGEEFTEGLTGWKRVMCWVGISLFIVSGLLYGLMAVAVAPQGVLAILGIIAGALVTPIQTVQELEVWVNWLDPLEHTKKNQGTNLAKGTGIALSIATVIVLSTLFTLGLASFLMSFGVAALPALIAGVAVAFTVGAFTEFFFYAPYLMSFCSDIKETWQDFKHSKKPVLGAIIVGLNAAANGVVAGFAIGLLIGVMVVAGAAVPPFGAILAVAIVAGLIAAAASFMLGTKFWVRKFGNPKPAQVNDSLREPLLDNNTHQYVSRFSPTLPKKSVAVPVVDDAGKDVSPVGSPGTLSIFGQMNQGANGAAPAMYQRKTYSASH